MMINIRNSKNKVTVIKKQAYVGGDNLLHLLPDDAKLKSITVINGTIETKNGKKEISELYEKTQKQGNIYYLPINDGRVCLRIDNAIKSIAQVYEVKITNKEGKEISFLLTKDEIITIDCVADATGKIIPLILPKK